MTLASEMEKLSQEISNSKELRRKEVESLTKSNREMLQDFNQKREEMAREQKEELAREKKLRIEDCQTRKKQTREMLQDLSGNHKQMAAELADQAKALKENLSKGEQERINSYYQMMEGIQTFVTKELEEMKKQLQRGEERRKEDVRLFLDELKKDREQAAQYWQSIGVLKKVVKKEPTPQFAEEQGIKDTNKIKEKTEVQFEPEMPLTERLLNYINAHPEGVRVSDMETPLGVIRVRLGQEAKILLEKGKVRKEDGVYYPL